MRVFITGSSRGIGYGIAEVFHDEGHTVILNGRTDAEQLRAASESLGGAEHYLADISDYEQTCDVFELIKRGGSLDALINCAGSEYFGLFSEMTPHDINDVLNNNLHTVLNACHLIVPDFVTQKRGVIINVSSIWGICGASCEAVYSSAKGAVNAFTKALAKELAPSGIRVNAIACGAFDTRMNERLTVNERAAFTEGIPMGRFGLPEEVGQLALFLAESGAEYLTGQVIILDGGMS
jgi:3-oxoacyl-[acyl-carrier protein] reductase